MDCDRVSDLVKKDEYVTIENTLAEDLAGKNSLMIRASMQDLYIYVDGQLREEYSTDYPDL